MLTYLDRLGEKPLVDWGDVDPSAHDIKIRMEATRLMRSARNVMPKIVGAHIEFTNQSLTAHIREQRVQASKQMRQMQAADILPAEISALEPSTEPTTKRQVGAEIIHLSRGQRVDPSIIRN